MARNDTTRDRGNGEEQHSDQTTYRVPITAHGGVYVVADDKETASEEAVTSVDSGTLELSRDISLERIREEEPVSGTPANVSESESDRVSVPVVPSVQELRRVRERRGFSMAEVARYLDVTASGIGKWEREDSAISLEQASNYAQALRRLSPMEDH